MDLTQLGRTLEFLKLAVPLFRKRGVQGWELRLSSLPSPPLVLVSLEERKEKVLNGSMWMPVFDLDASRTSL